MIKSSRLAFAALSVLALSACGDAAGGGGSRESIRAVGSSTVFPFAKLVSESFVRSNPEYPSPIIEATGSGGGIQLFCSGVGADKPDMANASRRMKASEFETCQQNGVTEITELQVGLDGIAFASAQGGITMNLTPKIVYEALAANPYGEEQTNRTWSDVDPSLPNEPILVYGPPSTSGTRDALAELVLEVGCDTNPEMEALKDSDEDQHARICTEVRSDGAYGYSYLEENADKVQGLSMNGVEPTYENISSFAYPGARPLYVYVKNAHLDAIPGLRAYLAEWGKMWSRGGPLADIGLVASPDDVMARNTQALTQFPTLTAADFQ